MDEKLIQKQEEELQRTGQYYRHVCFMTIPLLCMACYFYGLRPLLLCGAALLTGNLCDRLVSLLRRRVYQASDFSNESIALLIALLMPATVDWYVVIAAVLAGVLRGVRRLRQLSLPPGSRGLRRGGSVLAGAGVPLSPALHQHPPVGCLGCAGEQHHL